jgi:K+-sensing histidine kinase KdpD
MALLSFLKREPVQLLFDVIITVFLFNILINVPNFNLIVQWPYSILTFIVLLFAMVYRKEIVRYIAGSR